MKRATIMVALLLMASPLYADAIIYTSESEFLRVLDTPYLLEDFDFFSYGSYKAQSLTLDENGYIAILSASRRLFSLTGSMSTNTDFDVLNIDFTDSPNPVTAVGGYFWPTDLPGNNLAGPIRIVLSNGDEFVVENASYGDFLGFTVIDGTTFQFLQISTLVASTWPTVDHLYVGNDPPIPNPEPSSLLLLCIGISGIGIAVLRKKKYSNPAERTASNPNRL